MATQRVGAVGHGRRFANPVACAAGVRPPLDSPADLRRYTLLHEENRQGWARWFEAAGAEEASVPERGPLLADAALSKQAAMLGHGVALGDLLLVYEELQLGTLVKPFETNVVCGGYWLVAKNLAKLSEPAQCFAEWVKAEFADSLEVLDKCLASA